MSQQEEYKLTYIKNTTQTGKPMSSNLYINTKDFRLLKGWINKEGKKILPPDPLIAKVKVALSKQFKAKKYSDSDDEENFNLGKFKLSLPSLLREVLVLPDDLGLLKLLLDNIKFRQELEAMMQEIEREIEGEPFKGDETNIENAIQGILFEFKSIVDGIPASEITPGATPSAPPGAPPSPPSDALSHVKPSLGNFKIQVGFNNKI